MADGEGADVSPRKFVHWIRAGPGLLLGVAGWRTGPVPKNLRPLLMSCGLYGGFAVCIGANSIEPMTYQEGAAVTRLNQDEIAVVGAAASNEPGPVAAGRMQAQLLNATTSPRWSNSNGYYGGDGRKGKLQDRNSALALYILLTASTEAVGRLTLLQPP